MVHGPAGFNSSRPVERLVTVSRTGLPVPNIEPEKEILRHRDLSQTQILA